MKFDTTGALAAGYTQVEIDAYIKANEVSIPEGPQPIDVAEEIIAPVKKTVEPVTREIKKEGDGWDLKNVGKVGLYAHALAGDAKWAKKVMDAGKLVLNNLSKFAGRIPPKVYKEVTALKAAGKVNLALTALITAVDVYDTVNERNRGELKDTGNEWGNAGVRALRQVDKTLFDALPDRRTKDSNFDRSAYDEKQLQIQGMGGAEFLQKASAERLKLNAEAAAKYVSEKRKTDPSYTVNTFYKQFTYNPTLNKFIPNK